MSRTALRLILLLVVVTLLVGVGVLALLLHQPSWCAPMTGALAAMTVMAAIAGLIVSVAHA
ncbi:hypothetical protein ADL00_02720 [Streptomyces sp. AS58]|uniref:hypothetical protein n=1 Tax=Streptomyces sp. AS58 TaxID=1519489 RepID=UPI0006B04472|nr:hypothetical protein [Streptomyces sp. AS58]KOV74200.1 hypothetical protein ADL00_02720 [Streptomyces sp. AS58]